MEQPLRDAAAAAEEALALLSHASSSASIPYCWCDELDGKHTQRCQQARRALRTLRAALAAAPAAEQGERSTP